MNLLIDTEGIEREIVYKSEMKFYLFLHISIAFSIVKIPLLTIVYL